ncbi:MAG: nitroreductase family protein [Odoribacter splanchnicus]
MCLRKGLFVSSKSLEPVTKDCVGCRRQGFVATAPVCLVMVADLSKFGGEVLMPALDAGIVSQNISLFCSGTGLVTVPRASMDQAKLKSGLKLKDTQRPLINHPVGYAK